jgi:hypothetical protein
VQTQYVDRQWSTEADRAPVVCAIRPNYGDNGEDNFGPVEVRIYFFPVDGYRCVQLQKTSTREAVDVLCALGVLPAELSSIFTAGREWLLHVPNDIEATGGCCCNGCIGQGLCDLYDPCDADERAENDAERIAEMSDDEQERCGEL